MNNIEFFLNNNKTIDILAEEITIVGDRVEENLFDSKNIPNEYLKRFTEEIKLRFNKVIDLNKLQQFSFQAADFVTYHEHKFMAVFAGGKVDCHKTAVNVVHPHDDYCVNFFIDTLREAPKFYDLEIHNHTQPALPKGAKLITHWGQGVSENTNIKDVYFLYNDVKSVSDYLKMPCPDIPPLQDFINDTSFNKVFGLTYNNNTLKPLKLKLYYYPSDPLMEHTVYDETLNASAGCNI